MASATPSRAAFLDRALRDLMAACREASAPAAARCTPCSWTTRPSPSGSRPPSPRPVGEWHTDDDGATWVRDHFEPTEALADETVALPRPGQPRRRRRRPRRAGRPRVRRWRRRDRRRPDAWRARSRRRSPCRAAPPPGPPTCASPPSGLPAGPGRRRRRPHPHRRRPRPRGRHRWSSGSRRSAPTCSPAGWAAVRRCPSQLVVVGEHADDELADRLVGLTGPERQSLAVVLAGGHRAARWTAARRQRRPPAARRARHHRDRQPDRSPSRSRASSRCSRPPASPTVPTTAARCASPSRARKVDDAAWTHRAPPRRRAGHDRRHRRGTGGRRVRARPAHRAGHLPGAAPRGRAPATCSPACCGRAA